MSSSNVEPSNKVAWFRSFNAKMKVVAKRKYAEDKAKKAAADKGGK